MNPLIHEHKGSTRAKPKARKTSKEVRDKVEPIHLFFDPQKQGFLMVSGSQISTLDRAFVWRDPNGTKSVIAIPSKDIMVNKNKITVYLPLHVGPVIKKVGKIVAKGRVMKLHLKMIEKANLNDAESQVGEYQSAPGTSLVGGVGGSSPRKMEE